MSQSPHAQPVSSESPPSDARWFERVVNQFEAALQAGQQPKFANYVGDGTGQQRLELLLKLVAADWQWRWHQAERRRVEDYQAEWPELIAGDSLC